MSKKNRIKETASGTPGHMVVFPSKRAATVTTKDKTKIVTEKRQRIQKKKLWKNVRGSPASFDTMGLPATLATIIWIR